MVNNQAVIYSLLIYVLYLLIPLIPAILIFKNFPETKVAVSGPFQSLTVNTTGAFAAYLLIVLLGAYPVGRAELQLQWSRFYPVKGVIDLNANQIIQGLPNESYWTVSEITNSKGQLANTQYASFVRIIDSPDKKTSVSFDLSELPAQSGAGNVPVPIDRGLVTIYLTITDPAAQPHYRLETQGTIVRVVPESQ